jgi:hypothetical protein
MDEHAASLREHTFDFKGRRRIGTNSTHPRHEFHMSAGRVGGDVGSTGELVQGPPTAAIAFTRNNNKAIQPRTGRQASTRGVSTQPGCVAGFRRPRSLPRTPVAHQGPPPPTPDEHHRKPTPMNPTKQIGMTGHPPTHAKAKQVQQHDQPKRNKPRGS